MAMDKDGIAGMTSKQKLMIGAVIVILGVVVWQVMGLFGGSSEETIAPANQPAATSGKMMPPANKAAPGGAQQMPAASNSAAMQPAPTPTPIQQPVQTKTLEQVVNTDTLSKQQEQQKDFLNSVNQLQMLKLQRDIAETNQAIAAAKLATETTKKSISDLLEAKPATPAPVPAGAYANSLVNPTPAGMVPINQPNGGTPTSPPPIGDSAPSPYVVISVSMQMNKWTAVLGNGGKLYSVSVGDVLPIDGSVVASIFRGGVVLKKNGQAQKISLVPAI